MGPGSYSAGYRNPMECQPTVNVALQHQLRLSVALGSGFDVFVSLKSSSC